MGLAMVGSLTVASPAFASTGSVVRQPQLPGVIGYGLRITVTYDHNAPTTEWRMEFDLPDGAATLPWSGISFVKSGTNHWTAIYRSGERMVAGAQLNTTAVVVGTTLDPANCRIDGNPCAYSVAPPDTTPPTVPANVLASRGTYPGIGTGTTLNWSASTDNFGVAGYEVTINGQLFTTTTTNQRISVPNATVTTTYGVRAVDRFGNYSAYGTYVLPAP